MKIGDFGLACTDIIQTNIGWPNRNGKSKYLGWWLWFFIFLKNKVSVFKENYKDFIAEVRRKTAIIPSGAMVPARSWGSFMSTLVMLQYLMSSFLNCRNPNTYLQSGYLSVRLARTVGRIWVRCQGSISHFLPFYWTYCAVVSNQKYNKCGGSSYMEVFLEIIVL